MAKRRHRSGQRDHSSIARAPLLSVVPTKFERLAILELGDRRRFTPVTYDRVFSPRKDQRRIVHASVRHNVSTRRKSSVAMFSFARPERVSVCVRRHQRREVLFALRRTGRGARSRRTRNVYSGVSCK